MEDNYALASTDPRYAFAAVQEDAINLIGAVTSATVQNNYIRGGLSTSGCGILLESTGSGVQVLNNNLSNTGQCGIGVVSGSSILVDGNQVLNLQPVVGGGNAGLYLWKHYSWLNCTGVTVSNNTVAAINVLGQDTSYWYGGGCTPLLPHEQQIWSRRQVATEFGGSDSQSPGDSPSSVLLRDRFPFHQPDRSGSVRRRPGGQHSAIGFDHLADRFTECKRHGGAVGQRPGQCRALQESSSR